LEVSTERASAPSLTVATVFGVFVPHVDQRHQAVAADGVDVAARCRQAGDVHRVAGVQDLPDLLGVAVHQRQLARVTQGDGEDVLQVHLVHLLLRPLVHRHQQLPGSLHVLQAELGRHIRRALDVARHDVDLFLGQDVVVVDHPALGAQADDLFQAVGTQLERAAFGDVAVLVLLGPVRLQVLAGGALAQHPVATGAAFEVDLLADLDFGLTHFWCRRALLGLRADAQHRHQCRRHARQFRGHHRLHSVRWPPSSAAFCSLFTTVARSRVPMGPGCRLQIRTGGGVNRRG
jgi:hypothetical protein